METSVLEWTVASLRARKFKSIVFYVFMGEEMGCVVRVFYGGDVDDVLFGCFIGTSLEICCLDVL